MGLNAYVALQFKKKPNESTIKQFRFNLLHRFSEILSIYDGRINEVLSPADELIEIPGYPPLDRVYEVNLSCRYYGEGYERGPGLLLAGLLIFLCRHDWVESVYYGSDGTYCRCDMNDAVALLKHWCDHGNIPYAMDVAGASEVMCPNCDMPMYVCGGGLMLCCGGCSLKKKYH